MCKVPVVQLCVRCHGAEREEIERFNSFIKYKQKSTTNTNITQSDSPLYQPVSHAQWCPVDELKVGCEQTM